MTTPGQLTYLVLAGLACAESIGIPVPGTTALVTAGLLAASGRMNLTLVCLLSIAVAIIGGNIGYGIGWRYGTRFLTAPGRLSRHRSRVYHTGMALMRRYGWFAVLFSRDITVLRECAPLLAGSLRMAWPRYLIWNSIGAVAWVLSHVLLAFYLGSSVGTFRAVEIIVAIEVVIIAGTLVATSARRRARARAEQRDGGGAGQVIATANAAEPDGQPAQE